MNIDHLLDALWCIYTNLLVFPPPGEENQYQELVRQGYAEGIEQGDSTFYRITQEGNTVADALWRHA